MILISYSREMQEIPTRRDSRNITWKRKLFIIGNFLGAKCNIDRVKYPARGIPYEILYYWNFIVLYDRTILLKHRDRKIGKYIVERDKYTVNYP